MDRKQFIEHVESNQRALRRFLTALCCGDSMLADDIAQDTLVKAYLSCHSFKEGGNFTNWIYKIAYNSFISSRRKDKKHEPIAEAEKMDDENAIDKAFEYQELYQALDQLSKKERTVTLLFYMQGYSVKEIADITDSSSDAVRQQLSRARQHLKNLLDDN